MLDDPKTLSSANWNDVQDWLRLMWIYLPLVITFAFTLLVAHAFIPSLISTGHLPAEANKVRLPLTALAFLLLIAAAIIMAIAIDLTLRVRNVWDRLLI